jgi:hypothetical protein
MKHTIPDIPAALIGRQLVIESRAMLQHALASGMRVPADLIAAVVQSAEPPHGDARAWADAHAQLADMVAPATPRMLTLLAASPEDRTAWRRLGNVPLVRQLMYVAIGSLVAFIALSMSPYIQDPRNGNMYSSSGWPLLVNEAFYLCAAAMGASFANLFEAITQVLRARFDPLTEYFYWMRFLLGLIAGLLLATVLEVNIEVNETADAGARLGAAGLSLVGGFSANLLYRVLTRLTESVELMLVGRTAAQTPETWRTAATHTEQRATQDRMAVVREMLALRGQLGDGTPAEVQARIDALLERLLGALGGSTHGFKALAPGTPDAEGATNAASEEAANTASEDAANATSEDAATNAGAAMGAGEDATAGDGEAVTSSAAAADAGTSGSSRSS